MFYYLLYAIADTYTNTYNFVQETRFPVHGFCLIVNRITSITKHFLFWV